MNIKCVMKRLEKFEGRIYHMYKCTGGKVTVGVGHAIKDSADLFGMTFRTADGQPASFNQCVNDYQAVLGAPTGLKASAYKEYTKLNLPYEQIDAKLYWDICEFQELLCDAFVDFPLWPDPAQEAVFDMAYNLGVAGLIKKFPNCVAAIRQGDWASAARRCHRVGISEVRNRETVELFNAAVNSAAVPAV